jgi:hypothetical protein
VRHRLSFCPLLAPPRQGEFLGQTKKKVDDLMASAPGGMVFIDEAYNLGGRSLYAKEAVDQLTFCMTDKPYKGKSVVVLARTRPARPAMPRSWRALYLWSPAQGLGQQALLPLPRERTPPLPQRIRRGTSTRWRRC